MSYFFEGKKKFSSRLLFLWDSIRQKNLWIITECISICLSSSSSVFDKWRQNFPIFNFFITNRWKSLFNLLSQQNIGPVLNSIRFTIFASRQIRPLIRQIINFYRKRPLSLSHSGRFFEKLCHIRL